MTPGILKLLHIRFVENGFKLWYNYVNVNSICGFDSILRTYSLIYMFFTSFVTHFSIYQTVLSPTTLESVLLSSFPVPPYATSNINIILCRNVHHRISELYPISRHYNKSDHHGHHFLPIHSNPLYVL